MSVPSRTFRTSARDIFDCLRLHRCALGFTQERVYLIEGIEHEPKRATQARHEQEYGAIIKDPAAPASRLRVIVSDMRAKPFFEDLMKKYSIPGEVVIEP